MDLFEESRTIACVLEADVEDDEEDAILPQRTYRRSAAPRGTKPDSWHVSQICDIFGTS